MAIGVSNQDELFKKLVKVTGSIKSAKPVVPVAQSAKSAVVSSGFQPPQPTPGASAFDSIAYDKPTGLAGFLQNPLVKYGVAPVLKYGVLKPLQTIDTPRRAVISGVREVVDALDNDAKTKAGFGDFLKQTKDVNYGFGTAFPMKGKMGRVVGFVGDVLLDPLTYATLGQTVWKGAIIKSMSVGGNIVKTRSVLGLKNITGRKGREALSGLVVDRLKHFQKIGTKIDGKLITNDYIGEIAKSTMKAGKGKKAAIPELIRSDIGLRGPGVYYFGSRVKVPLTALPARLLDSSITSSRLFLVKPRMVGEVGKQVNVSPTSLLHSILTPTGAGRIAQFGNTGIRDMRIKLANGTATPEEAVMFSGVLRQVENQRGVISGQIEKATVELNNIFKKNGTTAYDDTVHRLIDGPEALARLDALQSEAATNPEVRFANDLIQFFATTGKAIDDSFRQFDPNWVSITDKQGYFPRVANPKYAKHLYDKSVANGFDPSEIDEELMDEILDTFRTAKNMKRRKLVDKKTFFGVPLNSSNLHVDGLNSIIQQNLGYSGFETNINTVMARYVRSYGEQMGYARLLNGIKSEGPEFAGEMGKIFPDAEAAIARASGAVDHVLGTMTESASKALPPLQGPPRPKIAPETIMGVGTPKSEGAWTPRQILDNLYVLWGEAQAAVDELSYSGGTKQAKLEAVRAVGQALVLSSRAREAAAMSGDVALIAKAAELSEYIRALRDRQSLMMGEALQPKAEFTPETVVQNKSVGQQKFELLRHNLRNLEQIRDDMADDFDVLTSALENNGGKSELFEILQSGQQIFDDITQGYGYDGFLGLKNDVDEVDQWFSSVVETDANSIVDLDKNLAKIQDVVKKVDTKRQLFGHRLAKLRAEGGGGKSLTVESVSRPMLTKKGALGNLVETSDDYVMQSLAQLQTRLGSLKISLASGEIVGETSAQALARIRNIHMTILDEFPEVADIAPAWNKYMQGDRAVSGAAPGTRHYQQLGRADFVRGVAEQEQVLNLVRHQLEVSLDARILSHASLTGVGVNDLSTMLQIQRAKAAEVVPILKSKLDNLRKSYLIRNGVDIGKEGSIDNSLLPSNSDRYVQAPAGPDKTSLAREFNNTDEARVLQSSISFFESGGGFGDVSLVERSIITKYRGKRAIKGVELAAEEEQMALAGVPLKPKRGFLVPFKFDGVSETSEEYGLVKQLYSKWMQRKRYLRENVGGLREEVNAADAADTRVAERQERAKLLNRTSSVDLFDDAKEKVQAEFSEIYAGPDSTSADSFEALYRYYYETLALIQLQVDPSSAVVGINDLFDDAYRQLQSAFRKVNVNDFNTLSNMWKIFDGDGFAAIRNAIDLPLDSARIELRAANNARELSTRRLLAALRVEALAAADYENPTMAMFLNTPHGQDALNTLRKRTNMSEFRLRAAVVAYDDLGPDNIDKQVLQDMIVTLQNDADYPLAKSVEKRANMLYEFADIDIPRFLETQGLPWAFTASEWDNLFNESLSFGVTDKLGELLRWLRDPATLKATTSEDVLRLYGVSDEDAIRGFADYIRNSQPDFIKDTGRASLIEEQWASSPANKKLSIIEGMENRARNLRASRRAGSESERLNAQLATVEARQKFREEELARLETMPLLKVKPNASEVAALGRESLTAMRDLHGRGFNVNNIRGAMARVQQVAAHYLENFRIKQERLLKPGVPANLSDAINLEREAIKLQVEGRAGRPAIPASPGKPAVAEVKEIKPEIIIPGYEFGDGFRSTVTEPRRLRMNESALVERREYRGVEDVEGVQDDLINEIYLAKTEADAVVESQSRDALDDIADKQYLVQNTTDQMADDQVEDSDVFNALIKGELFGAGEVQPKANDELILNYMNTGTVEFAEKAEDFNKDVDFLHDIFTSPMNDKTVRQLELEYELLQKMQARNRGGMVFDISDTSEGLLGKPEMLPSARTEGRVSVAEPHGVAQERLQSDMIQRIIGHRDLDNEVLLREERLRFLQNSVIPESAYVKLKAEVEGILLKKPTKAIPWLTAFRRKGAEVVAHAMTEITDEQIDMVRKRAAQPLVEAGTGKQIIKSDAEIEHIVAVYRTAYDIRNRFGSILETSFSGDNSWHLTRTERQVLLKDIAQVDIIINEIETKQQVLGSLGFGARASDKLFVGLEYKARKLAGFEKRLANTADEFGRYSKRAGSFRNESEWQSINPYNVFGDPKDNYLGDALPSDIPLDERLPIPGQKMLGKLEPRPMKFQTFGQGSTNRFGGLTRENQILIRNALTPAENEKIFVKGLTDTDADVALLKRFDDAVSAAVRAQDIVARDTDQKYSYLVMQEQQAIKGAFTVDEWRIVFRAPPEVRTQAPEFGAHASVAAKKLYDDVDARFRGLVETAYNRVRQAEMADELARTGVRVTPPGATGATIDAMAKLVTPVLDNRLSWTLKRIETATAQVTAVLTAPEDARYLAAFQMVMARLRRDLVPDPERFSKVVQGETSAKFADLMVLDAVKMRVAFLNQTKGLTPEQVDTKLLAGAIEYVGSPEVLPASTAKQGAQVPIDNFRGSFLSNFHPVEITWQGITYPSVEHFYQAQKVTGLSNSDAAVVRARQAIAALKTPGEAKVAGRKYPQMSERKRIEVMRYALEQKFAEDTDLAQQLMATGEAQLLEKNTWGDVYWGVNSAGEGENRLGKMLMDIRRDLQAQEMQGEMMRRQFQKLKEGAVVPTTVGNLSSVKPGRRLDMVTLNKDTVYIGRKNGEIPASKWRNEFKLEGVTPAERAADRPRALALYEKNLRQNKALLSQLPELKGKNLMCWCSPDLCHGHVLQRYVNAIPTDIGPESPMYIPRLLKNVDDAARKTEGAADRIVPETRMSLTPDEEAENALSFEDFVDAIAKEGGPAPTPEELRQLQTLYPKVDKTGTDWLANEEKIFQEDINRKAGYLEGEIPVAPSAPRKVPQQSAEATAAREAAFAAAAMSEVPDPFSPELAPSASAMSVDTGTGEIFNEPPNQPLFRSRAAAAAGGRPVAPPRSGGGGRPPIKPRVPAAGSAGAPPPATPRGILTAGMKQMGRQFPSMQMNGIIHEMWQNAGVFEDPKMAKFLKGTIGEYTKFYKVWTTTTPGFHTRNFLANFVQSLIAGVTPRSMYDGSKVYFGWLNAMRDGKNWQEFLMTIPDVKLRREANVARNALHGSGGGIFTDTFQTSYKGSKLIENRVTSASLKFARESDDYSRFVMGFDSARKGEGVPISISRIKKWYFDYEDISQLDKTMKEIIPFWIWTSRNLALHMQNIYLDPRPYQLYNNLVRNFKSDDSEESTPPFVSETGGWKLPFGNGLYATPDINFNRLPQQMKEIASGTRYGSNLNPVFRLPLEQARGKTFFGDKKMEGSQERLMQLLQGALPPAKFADRLFNTEGEAQKNAWLSFLGSPVKQYNKEE